MMMFLIMQSFRVSCYFVRGRFKYHFIAWSLIWNTFNLCFFLKTKVVYTLLNFKSFRLQTRRKIQYFEPSGSNNCPNLISFRFPEMLVCVDGRVIWHEWGAGELHTGVWWGDLREGDHLEDLGVGGTVILKWNLKEWDGQAWTALRWLRIGTGGGLL
jgi:hypothetical protein